MGKDFFTKKVRIICATLFFVAFTVNKLSEYPFELPQESELNYSTGVFNIIKEGKNINHVLLTQINNQGGSQNFSCSYSPLKNGSNSSCGDKKYLEPVTGNIATIGWYITDDFFGFKNNKAQLVTIEVEGETVQDYQFTLEDVKRSRQFQIFFGIPLAFICSSFLYWFLGLGNK